MKAVIQKDDLDVSPDEIKRRIDIYRQEGFRHQAMPHVVYHDPFIVCPWSECDTRITAIDFQIEKKNDPQLYQEIMTAWWQGPGIAACCPGCKNYVLFCVTKKECIESADVGNFTVLPDDWHQKAHIVK